MTKDELIRALEPFTDELEIMIGHAGRWYEVDNHEYAQRFGGEGCLVLNLGAQILLRTRARKETPAVPPIRFQVGDKVLGAGSALGTVESNDFINGRGERLYRVVFPSIATAVSTTGEELRPALNRGVTP